MYLARLAWLDFSFVTLPILIEQLHLITFNFELWNASHAVIGFITIVAIQRAIHKVPILASLSREFKLDETNRA